jgi:hypothetical protein
MPALTILRNIYTPTLRRVEKTEAATSTPVGGAFMAFVRKEAKCWNLTSITS